MTPKEFREWIDCGYSLLLLISATGVVFGVNVLIFMTLKPIWKRAVKI